MCKIIIAYSYEVKKSTKQKLVRVFFESPFRLKSISFDSLYKLSLDVYFVADVQKDQNNVMLVENVARILLGT